MIGPWWAENTNFFCLISPGDRGKRSYYKLQCFCQSNIPSVRALMMMTSMMMMLIVIVVGWCRWWWWWWWCQPSIPALRAGTEILLWYEKLPARRAQASQFLKEDNIMHSFSGTKYLQTLVWFTNHDDGPSICLFEPQLLVVYLGGRKILLSGFFPLKGGIAPYSARGKFQ